MDWGVCMCEHVCACACSCVCVHVCGLSWVSPLVWALVPGESRAGEDLSDVPLAVASASALSAQVTCSQVLALCLVPGRCGASWRQVPTVYYIPGAVDTEAHALCLWWAPGG